MAIPKDLPKEMRGLWKAQYEIREKALLESGLSVNLKQKYRKYKWVDKIGFIDFLQERGFFE